MSNKRRRRRPGRRKPSPSTLWLTALAEALQSGAELPDGLTAEDILAVANALAGHADDDALVVVDDDEAADG